MPEMDGFELLSRLREDSAACRIPVVVVTAKILSRAEIDMLNAGVSGILSKTAYHRDELVAAVRRALVRWPEGAGQLVPETDQLPGTSPNA